VNRNKLLQSDFGQTLKNSWTYLSGSVALKSLSIIGIPIMTRLLTEEDYGILNIFASFVSMAPTVLALNTNVGVGRRYFESDGDFKDYLGTSFMISYSLIIVASIFMFTNAAWFADLLSLPEITIFFIGPFAIRAINKSFHLQVFRAKSEPKKVRSLSLISGYIGFVLGVTLVYFHPEENRYMGQIWSGLIMTFLASGIIIYRLRSSIKFNPKWEHVKYMFSFGLPLMPSYLSSVVLAQFDRVMIGSYLGNGESGQYSFAYNISMLQLMLVNALYYSWEPKYYKYMKAKEYGKHDQDTLKLLSIASFAACGLILFSDWIGYILGSKSFHKSLYLIPTIVLGQFLLAINPIYKRHISFAKKTIYTSIVVLLCGALNIWLNSIYIPVYGAGAAAYTTVASYAIMFLLIYFVVRFILKSHVTSLWKVSLKMAVVVSACIFYYVELYVLEGGLLLGIFSKLLMLVVCGILLFKPKLRTIEA